ncbi:Stf0 family sulfotransferase [Paenibacillus paeoniae]|uniref:Sulphotransferase Stf0 domain-containing protein n=1 Tax=Paenibacillus paeoniae TaxID=2292705 RepID=A0A371PMK0_9BACL|nr:Stf0 family sulfotransferase [Paenibacillus paeoniae]REK76889.1 hypothetical protein DX130_07665 [Paenibacillus paeoniae]
MRPTQSYTIWFSQRTGSTLLGAALGSTGVAGNHVGEWLHGLKPHEMKVEDMEQMWAQGTSPNGVFGLKTSYQKEWINVFRDIFELPKETSRADIWNTAFPNCNKHIYMTRRNKVRLAVSWWRAIVSDEWHRNRGEKPSEVDLANRYNYEAINHLLLECTLREAALEDFFSEAGIVPLTIVYEDFIFEYEATVRRVLAFLEIQDEGVIVAPPAYDKLADEVAEEWVQRFRRERQAENEMLVW